MRGKWMRQAKTLIGKRLSPLRSVCIAIATCLIIISCATAPLQPLRISCTVWLGYEPLLLARDLGYFEDTPIQVLETTDHAASIKRFTNGNVEMGTMTLDVTLENAAIQDQIRAFLVMDISNGADALISQPDIKQLSELKGKRVGIMPATLGKLVLTRALEAGGLIEDDVTLVTLDFSQHEAAFQAKEIDALITYDPELSKLQAEGANLLFDSSQMPGEIIDLLVGREDLVATHEKQLSVLLEGWFKALDYIENNSDDAIARIAEREGMTPEQVSRGLSQLEYPNLAENLAILSQSDTTTIEGMNNLAQFLKTSQILETVVDPIQLLDERPLKTISSAN